MREEMWCWPLLVFNLKQGTFHTGAGSWFIVCHRGQFLTLVNIYFSKYIFKKKYILKRFSFHQIIDSCVMVVPLLSNTIQCSASNIQSTRRSAALGDVSSSESPLYCLLLNQEVVNIILLSGFPSFPPPSPFHRKIWVLSMCRPPYVAMSWRGANG